MKKTLKVMAMLLFVISMVSLASCKKQNAKLIVGKWECTSAVHTEYSETHSMPWLVGMVWEFKTNGDFIGSIEDLDDEYDNDVVSGTYVVLGNVLTITYLDDDGDVDSESYLIKELTETKLVIIDSEWDDDDVVEFKKII